MANNPKQSPENLDPDKIKAFREMYEGAMQYAAQHQVPIQVVEGALRDGLAMVEGLRLMMAMRKHGARI